MPSPLSRPVPSSPSRRGFIAAGSGLAAATALSGCSALASADSGPDTLIVHTQLGTTAPGSATYTAAVKAFHEENPGLRVKNLVNGDDLPQVYETSRLARKEPDVVMVNLYDKTLAWTDVGAAVDAGINVAIDPIPSPTGETASPFAGVKGFFVSSESKNKVAANDFLVNYLGTEDVQLELFKAGNVLPALTAANVAGYVLAGQSASGLPAGSFGYIWLPALAVIAACSVLMAPLR